MMNTYNVTAVDDLTSRVTTSSMNLLFQFAARFDELGLHRSQSQQTRLITDDRSSGQRYFFSVDATEEEVHLALIDKATGLTYLEHLRP